MRTLAVILILLTTVDAWAAIIQPHAVISEEFAYYTALNTINNERMITPVSGGDTLASALQATHEFHAPGDGSYASTDPGGFPSDLFASLPLGKSSVVLVFDLTEVGDVTFGSILLWNYENDGANRDTAGNQLRSLEVRVNTEAQGAMSFEGRAVSITMLPVWDGDDDDSNDLGGTNSAQLFSLGIQSGRYVQLSLTDNYYGLQGSVGGGDRVGLGEVRFDSAVIPEPKTFVDSFLVDTGGVVQLAWEDIGFYYTVEYTYDLQNPDWLPVDDGTAWPIATNRWTCSGLQHGSPLQDKANYRVQCISPPVAGATSD